MRTRSLLTFLLLGITPTAGGCCSLSRLFCGADETPWFDPGYSTPEQAVATVLEAMKREEVDQLFAAMTPELRTNMGIPTALEAAVAKEEILKQAPYMFMAGYADPGMPELLDETLARYEFEVEGRPVTLEFQRRVFRQVVLDLPFLQNEPVRIKDHLNHATLAPAIRVRSDGMSPATLELDRPIRLEDGLEIEASQVRDLHLGYEWKLAGFKFSEPE